MSSEVEGLQPPGAASASKIRVSVIGCRCTRAILSGWLRSVASIVCAGAWETVDEAFENQLVRTLSDAHHELVPLDEPSTRLHGQVRAHMRRRGNTRRNRE
jgi:hypothetical protein